MAEQVGGIYFDVRVETGQMIRGQRQVDAALKSTENRIDSFQGKLSSITDAIKTYAAATFLIGNTDAYTKLNAQLKLATDGHSSLAVAQETVRRISQESQTDISALAMLYARVTNATKELRLSQFSVGEITRVVALSLKVSGASAAEAASAMLQLSQAFGSGVLRGEEFNAVNEAAPRLMKALADGIGVPVARLRSMAENGKLTASVLAEALPKSLAALQQEAQQVQTISGAFQVLKNEVMLFVGAQTTANGTAAAAASALATLAQNLDLVTAAAVGLGAAKLASIVLAASVATVTNTKAVIEAVAAEQARVASSAASAQMRVQEAAATAAATRAELAATQARLADLEAANAGLAVSRAEYIAKLQSAQASAAQARAQIAAATAAGAQSYALAMLRSGTADLTTAQALQAKVVNDLAVLGRQQALVTAQLTAATNAQAAATRSLSAAQSAQAVAQNAANTAAGASTGIMAAARGALGLLGGPIGIITTLLGIGATAWMLWGNSAEEAGDKAAAALEKALDKGAKAQREATQQVSRANAALEEEKAKGYMADQRRIDTLTKIRDRAVAKQLEAEKQITGAKAEAAGRDQLERNYVTRYENPEVIKKRQREAVAAFKAANQSDREKYKDDLAKLRAEGGGYVDADAIARLKKKHHLDKDPEAGKLDGAKAYLAELVSENQIAIEKINAEEQKALHDNAKRAATDKANAGVYAQAKAEIIKKFARERAQVEEKTAQETADMYIKMTTDEAQRIEMVQAEAIRRANVAENLKTITHAEAEKQRTLATFEGEQARADLAERNAKARAERDIALTTDVEGKIYAIRDEALRQAEEAYRRGKITFEEAEAKKVEAAQQAADQIRQVQANRGSTMLSVLQLRASASGDVEDQVAVIRAEAAAKLAASQQAWATDMEYARLYAAEREAIERNMYANIAKIRADAQASSLSSMSSALGQMTDVLKNAAGEQSGVYRVMFAAQKAFAIASAIVSINKAVADVAATEATWPTKLAAMASITAATASIIGNITGVSYGGGRQYGGPVSAGSMYRVNESGRPEMFTASNGSQYMLPTANGNVTPAGQVGNGGVTVILNNAPAGTEATASVNGNQVVIDLAVKAAEAKVADGIATNTGPVWGALRGSTNVRAGGLS